MDSHPKIEILFLSKEEVEGLVTVEDAVMASEEAYRALGEGQLVQDHCIVPIKKPNVIATMPTYLRSLNLYGMKQVGVYAHRESGDRLPSVWGSFIVLTRVENGLPYVVMDGTAITNMRSAGGHAVVAAKYLARRDSKTLAVIGCGAQGRMGLRSLVNHFSLTLVKAYDVSAEAVSHFSAGVGKEIDVPVVPVDSARKAVEGADILFVSSTAQEPVVMEPWVEKGSFVAGLMAFRDLDPMLGVKAEKWVLGSLQSDGHMIIDGGGGLAVPREINKGHVYGDMGEIVTGIKQGRENDRERIVYTHMGMGAHDIILARKAYMKAVEKCIGIKVLL
jgi:alanine dehydrogenase